MHAVVPFGDDDTETSQTLQRLLSDAWLRPYMRPRWLKVDQHRAQISDEFMHWCEQRSIEVVDTAGSAKEQQGKVEHHAQLFELMLEDVLADVEPQTECELRECLDSLQESKNSLFSVSGVTPMQLVFGRDPETPGDLLRKNPDLVANSSLLHDRDAGRAARVRTIARTKLMLHSDKLNSRRALDTRPRVVPTFLPGDMVAVWRMMKGGGIAGKRAHHRWRPEICLGPVRATTGLPFLEALSRRPQSS